MGENIPLTLGGGSTWEPGNEQDTSFGGESQRTKLKKEDVKGLYQKLSERRDKTSEAFHFDYFELRDGELYYKGKNTPLTNRGELKPVETIAEILGKGRIRDLGFDMPTGKGTAREAVKLNRVKEKLPSASDVAKADDTELQEIAKSMEDLIAQGQETSPMHELLGLDKQLMSIRSSLKVVVAKKIQLEESIKKEKCKLEDFRDHPGVYDDGIREDIMK